MNYRHIFHAGNICDVTKHSVLCLLLDHLVGKDTAFCTFDSHAGIGLYDLADERAQKTNEFEPGILSLLSQASLPELKSYYAALQKLNPLWNPGSNENFRFYPGSPRLIAETLRAQDRLIACEWHDEDVRALRRNLPQSQQIQIHHRDGYEALRALLPPPEKRGLILIDPPYEEADEFARLPMALADAAKRWPQATLMLWYPIKERPQIWKLHEALIATGLKRMLAAEFVYQPLERSDRLNGSGLILLNPPWQLDDKLRALFPALHQALNTSYQDVKIDWLAKE